MTKQSAGILLYTYTGHVVKVLLVHPGGPFWVKKDTGAWSIPKGEFTEDEEPFVAAKREFSEETGSDAPDGTYLSLGTAKQSSGKVVHAWACQADLDARHITSNTFAMAWPPRSGKQQNFPEVDKAAWFDLAKARVKIVKGQIPLLEALMAQLGQQLPTEQDDQPELPEQVQLL